MWIYLTDSAASRAQIAEMGGELETGLAGLRTILEKLSSSHPASEWPARLAAAYAPQLDRPIAETSPDEAIAGLVIPSVTQAYVNPWMLVAEYAAGARPAEEPRWCPGRGSAPR